MIYPKAREGERQSDRVCTSEGGRIERKQDKKREKDIVLEEQEVSHKGISWREKEGVE